MKIVFTPEAGQDLKNIGEYISMHLKNPIAAENTLKKIKKSYSVLKESAYIGTPLNSKIIGKTNLPFDYRLLVSGKYLIFYRIEEQNVILCRIIYGKRNYLEFFDLTDNI